MDSSTREEQIRRFFDGVIIDGVSREVVFPEYSEEEYIEVSLIAPPQVQVPPVHLSFPIKQETSDT